MMSTRMVPAFCVFFAAMASLEAFAQSTSGTTSNAKKKVSACHAAVLPWRSLKWNDAAVQKHIASLDEVARQKVEAARTGDNEKARSRMLRQIQIRIMLSSSLKGGALTPMAEQGTPWRHASPQKIVSLGRIAWFGDIEKAQAVAKETGRPLLVVSTELPGCGACVGHGQNQLSHPFVVDAAMEFVPVVVSGGWPKLMFKDEKGLELASFANHKTSVAETLKRMRDALRTAKRPVPEWLDLVVAESTVPRRATATFGMGCFWSGESKLGKIKGVLATRCGMLKGEVVELEFDPTVVSYEKLLKQAREFKCANKIVARTDEQAAVAKRLYPAATTIRTDESIKIVESGTKHSLKRNKALAALPLTELQATKMNSDRKNGETCLSPSQRLLRADLEKVFEQGKKLSDLKPDYSSLDVLGKYAEAVRTKLDERE